MSRQCTVCTHPKRVEVDALLVKDESLETVSKQYGITKSSLHRHKTNHLFQAVRSSKRAMDLVRSDNILDRVEDLITKTETILQRCETAGKDGIALAAIGEVRRNLDLLARLRGELRDQLSFNVLVNPSWMELRIEIMQALAGYPEARDHLQEVLERLGPSSTSPRPISEVSSSAGRAGQPESTL